MVLLSMTELEPYKYAGYPMLIKTITMETEDSQLFSKTSPLLPAAVELAFHTVNCSALNAEELRRDNGIEVHFWLNLKWIHLSVFNHHAANFNLCIFVQIRCCWKLFLDASVC